MIAFNTLTLKQIFWKTKKPFFKKLEYRFLVESTNIEKKDWVLFESAFSLRVSLNRTWHIAVFML